MEKVILSISLLLKVIIVSLIIAFLSGCKKYLDATPDKKLVVPSSIADLQGILDYYYYMNQQCSDEGEIATDNYFMDDNEFLALSADRMRNAYLWKPGIFQGASNDDWQKEYTIVYNANVVLDNIDKINIDATNSSTWNYCKGSALLFRGKSFYEIAQIWTKAYDSVSADEDLGIPLRLSSNFNLPTTRSNLKETYNQIITDLKSSISLLPDLPTNPFRPSKAAAFGLLARTYLAMRNYRDAGFYADSCLQINDKLLDYNTLNPNDAYPFSSRQYSNPEDIMHTVCQDVNYDILPWSAHVDTLLFDSYDSNDLRKTIFYDNLGFYKGSYDGYSALNYNGIATDEIYLIRAECNARQGNVAKAMSDLNTLLKNRWKTGTFIQLTALNQSDALNKILNERRKELVFRTLRFTDLKRLNKEGANITLKRIIQGQTYTLPPNDPRYALPIPDNVIQLTGIDQN